MASSSKHNTDAGLSKPLSERERRHSQRAFIAMAVLVTVAGTLLAPNGILGIYLIKLKVTGQQLGFLIACAAPFGLAGPLFARMALGIGRKRMLAWGL